MAKLTPKVKFQLWVIANLWLAYVIFTLFSLRFKHWELPTISVVNYCLYFLITLLAGTVFLKGHYNKHIFLNIAIFAFVYVLGFIVIFIGKNYTFGNDYLQYYAWSYRKIIISIVTGLTIIFIPVDYLIFNKKTYVKYLIALGLCLPIALIYYKNFLLSHRYLFIDDHIRQIFLGFIGMNFWSLFFIILYAYLILKYDKPVLGHVNLLVFSFLLFISIDSLDNFFNYIRQPLPIFSGVLLFVNLLLFVSILLHNFFYVSSDFGQFYEQFRFSERKLGITILKRKTKIEKWMEYLSHNFEISPYRLFFWLLMAITICVFLIIYPQSYERISFIILAGLTAVILIYLSILTKKRASNDRIEQQSSQQPLGKELKPKEEYQIQLSRDGEDKKLE
ncbi:MAG: hypothetical protein ONB31_06695 [candidate division KSB1 bacterium]|nr:hypothetical protein [candidate division KSB1 bacterium]MDZ7333810.1 hypothetical protein [candidate division KSB1 bacterium]MDZ7356053.1 hypothetical protein [candidate division KSB1 bacterium]MDZ7400570.1 hypothetical protein [candidate division KSB1 bacterium]